CNHVIVNYGSTEAWVAAAAPYDAIADIPGAVGVLTPWTELEIVDEAGQPVPDGEDGHVRLRTPFFLAKLEGAGRLPHRKRWFYPGDIGSVKADRILCIQGRADEVINRGGVKILPAVLEDVLRTQPGVKDAGICAAPGTQAQELWIAVVADKNFSMPSVRQFLSTTPEFRIGSRSGTETIFVVTDIPRTELGKVKRHELRDRLVALRDRHRVAR